MVSHVTGSGKKEVFGLKLTRREILQKGGLVMGALALLPSKAGAVSRPAGRTSDIMGGRALPDRVYVVRNGSFIQNINKLLDMLGGIGTYINPSDHVVIKCNGQWPRQGYTHTGCIKAVIDRILAIPGFSGEIYICDNVQDNGTPGYTGFDVEPGYYREHNWPDHNWDTLAAEYQGNGYPVATKRWINSETDISTPGDGEGWMRMFFSYYGLDTYYSYPVFESPLTPGKMIDVKFGVWQGSGYTGQMVKTIVMPTLNNHGWGEEDYAGITSAIKSFIGATEVHYGEGNTFRGHCNWHGSTYGRVNALYAGGLTARYLQEMFAPIIYITPAIWSGHNSRTLDAVETKTVLACTNPATLDYISARDVISPYAPFLNPDNDNNTRRQILGCIGGGVGSIDPGVMSVDLYDFDSPDVPSLSIPGTALVLLAGGFEMLRERIRKVSRS